MTTTQTPTPQHAPSTPPTAGEPWETWGIAARWNPQHEWHAPDETP